MVCHSLSRWLCRYGGYRDRPPPRRGGYEDRYGGYGQDDGPRGGGGYRPPSDPPAERPRLQLQPRSKPKEETDTASPSAIFGGARPVDTAAKELERLKREEEEEKQRKEEGKQRKEVGVGVCVRGSILIRGAATFQGLQWTPSNLGSVLIRGVASSRGGFVLYSGLPLVHLGT